MRSTVEQGEQQQGEQGGGQVQQGDADQQKAQAVEYIGTQVAFRLCRASHPALAQKEGQQAAVEVPVKPVNEQVGGGLQVGHSTIPPGVHLSRRPRTTRR